ncbi:MAG: hypothetical protein JWO19_1024 [Bryobacterales bacterium]|nr:hypothetical protein [Bryobacterales bacterium]
MPTYRIHRLKDHLRAQVRFAPHVSGIATVKPRDYETADQVEAEQVEAPTPYAAYFALRDTATPLQVGDLLETGDGSLRVFKYVGFEEAQWALPEPKPAAVLPQPEEQSPALQ